MKKQLVLSVLFLICGKCFSCICPDLRYLPSEQEFEEYDFIAHVYIEKDDWYKRDKPSRFNRGIGLLEIQILELFKGDTSKYILEFSKHTSCELGIGANEEWLIFAKKNDDEQLTIGACDYAIQYKKQNGQRYTLGQRGIYTLNRLKKFYKHDLKKYNNETVKSYYKDGQIELLEHYKDGKLNGERKIWYPNGQMMHFSNYSNGQKHGAFIEYFENGQISEEGLFYNDKPIGVLKIYFDSQVIKRMLYWEFGTVDTLNFLYNTNIVQYQRVYDHKGNLLSRKSYDRFGNIENEVYYLDENIETNIYYHKNGQVRSVSYKKDNKDYGRYQSFHENGLPDDDNSWDYDENGKRIKNE